MRHPKPTVEQNLGRAARKVVAVLRDRTWVQGTVGTPENGMCTRGVISFTFTSDANNIVTNGLEIFSGSVPRPRKARPQALLAKNLEEAFLSWLKQNGYAYEYDCIPFWNDQKSRTKEEIIQLLEKFADEMDPQLV